MSALFSDSWSCIKSFSVWPRALVHILILSLVPFLSVSCGPTVRVSARTTTDSVTISISQSVVDSTGVSVSVNPNINF